MYCLDSTNPDCCCLSLIFISVRVSVPDIGREPFVGRCHEDNSDNGVLRHTPPDCIEYITVCVCVADNIVPTLCPIPLLQFCRISATTRKRLASQQHGPFKSSGEPTKASYSQAVELATYDTQG